MEKPSFEDHLINRVEAAKMLGVSRRTLEAWACRGKFDLPVVKIGRQNQYWLSDIINLTKKFTKGKTSLGGGNQCNNIPENI